MLIGFFDKKNNCVQDAVKKLNLLLNYTKQDTSSLLNHFLVGELSDDASGETYTDIITCQ